MENNKSTSLFGIMEMEIGLLSHSKLLIQFLATLGVRMKTNILVL